MSSADTPAVARRRVRLALRAAREAKGYTQGQVADAMDWSLSKLMRIEKGDVNIASADLRVLLEHLDVTDPATIKQLVNDARTARSERWTGDATDREHLTSPVVQLMQFEQEATAIRYYGSVIVPGLLQTRAYAQAILDTFDLDKVTAQTRIEARLRRRDQVLYRRDPPDYLVILDEAVLMREVGGPGIMGDQLRMILKIMAETKIQVRVVPFEAPATIAILGPFTLFDLGDEANAVLYRESHLIDEIVHSPSNLQRHRVVFEQLWTAALGDEASAELIERRATSMIKKAGGG
jgi:transcriptional regulator with XRE-family HTH domain